MKELSRKAKLSTIYTNHCIRASTVTQLDIQSFKARHIMAVLRHESENSIKNYTSVCHDIKKQEIFDMLVKYMKERTVTDPIPEEVNKLQNNNFNLVHLFPGMEDDPLKSENFLEMIAKKEKENLQIIPANTEVQQNKLTIPICQNLLVATSNKQNCQQLIQNINRGSPFLNMSFPN